MNGIFIGKNDYCKNKTEQPFAVLKLLLAENNLNIMTETISGGTAGCFIPVNENALVFVYIMQGELELFIDGESILLNEHEYFYIRHTDGNIPVFSKSGTQIFYISSERVYDYINSFNESFKYLYELSNNKDETTYQHSLRVYDYAKKLAKALKLSNESFSKLCLASLFHDIGKDSVPSEILNKPGSLTANEFDIVKKHTGDGYNLIKERFNDEIASIVYQHHERLDGSGYPKGLKSEDISFEAKIISVADVFDAITSERPYKKARSYCEAIDEINSKCGVLFDSDVVDALKNVLKQEQLLLQ